MDKNETKNAWEIQKNGLKGNTTISVVHYPMNLYGIINNLSENERNKAYEESSKAIINCLIEGLSSIRQIDSQSHGIRIYKNGKEFSIYKLK